jgi:pilus assembly protein CpaB
MRRGRIFFYLAFILILGLVAVVVVWQRFLAPQPAPVASVPTPVVDLVNVLVVTQRVPRGSALDETVLGMVPIQRDLYIQGMFTNVADASGRLARFDLDAGIPLTSGMLVDTAEQLSSTGSVAALSIPRGMVSISVPIDRLSSVSYAPKPGDHVNVIVTLLMADYDQDFQTILPNQAGLLLGPGPINPEGGPPAVTMYFKDGVAAGLGKAEIDPVLGGSLYVSPSEPQRPRMVSQSLLQDAVVLHMGEFPTDEEETQTDDLASASAVAAEPTPAPPAQAQAAAPGQEGEQVPAEPARPALISLIVTPQDAITLNYLIYSGARLTLALRAAGDDSRVQTEAVTLQYLMDQYNIPVPVKLPYGIPNRANDDHLEPFVPAPEPTATPVP